MKSYNSRELFKMAKEKGFRLDRINGSHHIFVHDERGIELAIPHPKKDFPKGTLRNILKVLGAV